MARLQVVGGLTFLSSASGDWRLLLADGRHGHVLVEHGCECRIVHLFKTDQFIVASTRWNKPEWELNTNRNLLRHMCVRGFLFFTKPVYLNPYDNRGIPLSKPRTGRAALISRDLMFLSKSCKQANHQPSRVLSCLCVYIFGYGSF